MPPRVAYFPDSFHEVNGVAHTSRNFVAFAERHDLPFLCVRAGGRTAPWVQRGQVQTLELPRSAISIALERDLAFDLLFGRHADVISRSLRAFQPDVIHITGPSELGIFGAYFAWKLGVPLAASWHTNVHEYAARRAAKVLRPLGDAGVAIERGIEGRVLDATTRFYRLAQVLYAPNEGLCSMLRQRTRKPCYLMQRGVDTDVFSPLKRTRTAQDGRLVLGYVGRLSVEKNVALLPKVDAALRARGLQVEWLIVGHGEEEATLRASLANATFAGVLQGEALARAFADMDVFVFPSHTDTFGNVVLEALASGVPAVVTPDGGPATIVQNGVTGSVVSDEGFADAIEAVSRSHEAMGEAARAHALGCSWDAVFERVYAAYPAAA